VLFVSRHAPSRTEVGTCIGQLDVPSDRNPRQVAEELLGSWNEAAEIHCVWSSPLQRCAKPAQVLAAQWHLPHRIDSRLLEISYGRWEGRQWKEIERVEANAFQAWMTDWERRGPPGGESAAAVEARVRSWWESLARDRDEVLIAHAGVIRALTVLSGAHNWRQAMQIAVPHMKWIQIMKPDATSST
jgi:alpha-ribazole phosphatase